MAVINGIDLADKAIYTEDQIAGNHKVDLVGRINQRAGQVYEITDEIYEEVVGKADRSFDFDFENTPVIQYYNPVFLENDPLKVLNIVDLTQDIILDRAISNSPENMILFINGVACYEGAGTATTWTPFTSTVADADRNIGHLLIAAHPDNVNVASLIVDRVKITFQKAGGGTEDVWFSLPNDRDLDPADVLFFDKFGACYNDVVLNESNFLSSFTIFEVDRFNKGAIANELYYMRGWGKQESKFLNIQNADGFDLTYLGEEWFGIEKRAGETDDNYVLRIISEVVGPKNTPFAIRQALLRFSPNLVLIQEGLKGFGAYRRSFYRFDQELAAATGVYTESVKPAYYGSIRNGLLFIRVVIESNAVTNDPVNAQFIFDLVSRIIIPGVTFEIQKV